MKIMKKKPPKNYFLDGLFYLYHRAMKEKSIYIIVLLFFTTFSLLSQNRKEHQITILYTNDIHGNYLPFKTNTHNTTSQTGDAEREVLIEFPKTGEIGGMAVMARAIKEIRRDQGKENVLLLDAGDTFGDDQLANITRGEAIIQMMKLLEYDFMALGNHDFDYGRQRTKELQTLAGFPFGGANIIDKETGKTFLDHPFLIKEISGIKLAIIALGYHNSLLTGNKDNMQGLNFLPGDQVLKKHLPLLSAKTDIIIVLSHQGTAVDRLTAKKFDDIDLIIGGHSHDIISGPEKINGIYLVQALSDAAVLGEIKLQFQDHKLQYAHAKSHLLWTDKHQADSKIQALITSLRKPHLEELEEKITVAKETIGRQYKSESPFEKLTGNLLRDHFNAEIALLPGVGYGISLSGTVTSEDIYRLLPHPSKIVTLNLTGKQIKSVLEQTATNQKPDEKQEVVGGLLQSSGVSYILDYSKPSGSRICDVQVNGKGLDLQRKYNVVTHSGMLNGLHSYDELRKGENIKKEGLRLNEFVIKKLRKLENISRPKNMGEVKIITE